MLPGRLGSACFASAVLFDAPCSCAAIASLMALMHSLAGALNMPWDPLLKVFR